MRRHLLIVAVFLLAGAVVNVAVAWGAACWPRDVYSISSKGNAALSVEDIAWWNEHVSPLFHCHAESAWKTREFGIEARIFMSAATTQGYVVAIHVASGWPARSMSGELWETQGKGTSPRWPWRRAVVVERYGWFAIPFRPIWPGFAINTIFYAVFLWLPFVLRRFIRVRRGLCPKCAYPMGESAVCSECGRALPSRRIIV